MVVAFVPSLCGNIYQSDTCPAGFADLGTLCFRIFLLYTFVAAQ